MLLLIWRCSLKTSFFFLASVIISCGSSGTVLPSDNPLAPQGGCRTNSECDDGDVRTEDRCAITPATFGVCHHIRSVFSICLSNLDCDDQRSDTDDECRNSICHHTVISDAAATREERQNARFICEDDVSCRPSSTGPILTLDPSTACATRTTRDPWREDGYPLILHLDNASELSRISLRLRLRVGDPRDLFRMNVWMNTPAPRAPDFVHTMSAPEIESGIVLAVPSGRVAGSADRVTLFILLTVIGAPNARTIQWGLAVDALHDETNRIPTPTCAASGLFMETPRHGILRLVNGANGEPQCAGAPTTFDWETIPPIGVGLARERNDPTLFYVSDSSTRRIIRFPGVAGLADWFLPSTACAVAKVMPDGALSTLHWPEYTTGIRPGVAVAWESGGALRFGITDFSWRIRAYDTPMPDNAGICTRANTFLMTLDTRIPPCRLLLENGASRYLILPLTTGWDARTAYDRATLETYADRT